MNEHRVVLLALCLVAACGDDGDSRDHAGEDAGSGDSGSLDAGLRDSATGTIDSGSVPDSGRSDGAVASDDAAISHGARSGLPANKTLIALSPAEVGVLCRWFADEQLESYTAEAECLPDAVFNASTEAECTSRRDSCLGEHAAFSTMRHDEKRAGCDEAVIGADCIASVSEFEACMRDGFADARAFAAMLSCSELMPTVSMFTTPSCENVGAACIP